MAEIHAAGGEAYANFDSVAMSEGATAIVEVTIAQFGRVDILVCNAGIWNSQPVVELGDEIWRRTLAAYASAELRPGRITASSVGLYGKQGMISYGAAKSASSES